MVSQTSKKIPKGLRDFTERVHRDGRASTTLAEVMSWFRVRKPDAASMHKKLLDSSLALEAEGYGVLITLAEETTLAEEVFHSLQLPVDLEAEIAITFEIRLAVYFSVLLDEGEEVEDPWEKDEDEDPWEKDEEAPLTKWWIGLTRDLVSVDEELTIDDGSFFLRARGRDDLPDHGKLRSGREIYYALLDIQAAANCNTLWLIEEGPEQVLRMLSRVDEKVADQFNSAVQEHARKVKAENTEDDLLADAIDRILKRVQKEDT